MKTLFNSVQQIIDLCNEQNLANAVCQELTIGTDMEAECLICHVAFAVNVKGEKGVWDTASDYIEFCYMCPVEMLFQFSDQRLTREVVNGILTELYEHQIESGETVH